MQSSYGLSKSGFVAGVKSAIPVGLAGLVLLYVSQITIARLLGPANYGTYSFTLSIVSVLVVVGKLGLDTTVQRYIPEYRSKLHWGPLKGIIIRALQISIACSLLLSLACATGIWLLKDTLPPTLLSTLLFGCIALPIATSNKVLQGVLIGLKRPGFSQISESILTPILLVAGLLAMYQTNSDQYVSSRSTILLHTSAWVAALIFSALLVHRSTTGPDALGSSPMYSTSEWISYSLPLLFISGTQLIIGYSDTIMIGLMTDMENVGIYVAATKVATLITIGLVLANIALTPYIAELYHKGHTADLQKIVKLSARISLAIAVPALVAITLSGKDILQLFGSGFSAGYVSLIILSISALFNVLSGSVGYIMSMTGNQTISARFFLASALINIVLNFLLIPAYGIEGAAAATACSIIFWNVLLALFIRSRLQIDSTAF